MDNQFSGLPNSTNAFASSHKIHSPSFDQSLNLGGGYEDNSLDVSIADIPFVSLSPGPGPSDSAPSFPLSYEGDSSDDQDSDRVLKFLNQILSEEGINEKPSMFHDPVALQAAENSITLSYEADSPDDQDSDPVLKFLNQILVEEGIDEKPSMFHDPLALRATEKSLYEALGKNYPPSPLQPSTYADQDLESPDSFLGSSSGYTSSSTTSMDPQLAVDPGEYNSLVEQSHVLLHSSSKSSLQVNSQGSSDSFRNSYNDNQFQASPFVNTNLFQKIFSDSESILQFKRGMEEASKFLPTANQLFLDLDKYKLPPKPGEGTPETLVKAEKEATGQDYNGSRGRKHQYPEDDDSDNVERSSKQSAVYVEEVELSDLFDRVLLFADASGQPLCSYSGKELPDSGKKSDIQTVPPNGLNGGTNDVRKQEGKPVTVDLTSLLICCAQSVAADDYRTAYEQLKQIRHHSSPTGDAYQRLAYIFASGLEARLAGTGTELYASLACRKITATEKLKAYQMYLSVCPFKKMSILFANKMIAEAASGATTLHIVDFGILYGFQWPILIHHLSQRPEGPPKLRITGIELPQPGFRPAERVEETGCRLARYCERFGVPFEYQPIATHNWETININDLKIASDEVLAVNTLFQFDRLLDETVVVDSPRDAVLRLIRKMNPNIFVQAVDNGSYSSPFFVTRFKEALFHYSALLDVFDVTLPRDHPQRQDFEQGFYGRAVMNVIACEGPERVIRPETYKKWQARTMRAGFKPLPLKQEIMKKLRSKAKAGYHKDFLFDEDGNWMLQGWKGRILCGSSCWVPA